MSLWSFKRTYLRLVWILSNREAPQLTILCFSGADSLAYLSVEGLVQAVRYRIAEKNSSKVGHCTACLTGNYPEKLEW